MELEHKVKNIIIDLIEENDLESIDIENISSSTRLVDDLGLDSLNLAQLTVMIESEFGVDIFEKRIIRSFGEIISLLK
tara:strand:- start:54 stop:287 length:234 start_codon:yes stop_codon:yes gene_type:complete